jgi:O-antigen ligase
VEPPAFLGRGPRAIAIVGRVLLVALAILAVWPMRTYLSLSGVSWTAALLVLVLVLAALRPADALLVAIALAPLAIPLGTILRSPSSLGTPLVRACLVGCLVHLAVRPHGRLAEGPRSLMRPAAVLAAVYLASCAVQLIVLQVSTDDGWPFLQLVAATACLHYFLDWAPLHPILAAGIFPLDCLGLFAAAMVLGHRSPPVGRRLLVATAVGAAGLAALSLIEFLRLALAGGSFWSTLGSQWATVRISPAFPDVNAAGSYLALALPIVAGLAWRDDGVRRRWLLVAALVAAGLWLAGSRAAVASATLVLLLMVLGGRRTRTSVALLLAGAVLMAVAVYGLRPTLAAWFDPPASTQRSLRVAFNVRAEMARTAFRMVEDHPAFGVGAGAFYRRSSEYITPWIHERVNAENAHNNFLQVVAELGLVGTVPFVWLFVAIGSRARQFLRRHRASGAVIGAIGGLVAFALTCLTGHPLLIQPVALAFWAAVGAVAGIVTSDEEPAEPAVPARSDAGRVRWSAIVATSSVVLLVASVPWRGEVALAGADLRDAAIGFSRWERHQDGTTFRYMKEHAQFFVPAGIAALRLPVRIDPGRSSGANIEIRIDDRPPDRVHVEGEQWTRVMIGFDRDRTGRRYRRVRLEVPNGPVRILVGRPEELRPGTRPVP